MSNPIDNFSKRSIITRTDNIRITLFNQIICDKHAKLLAKAIPKNINLTSICLNK